MEKNLTQTYNTARDELTQKWQAFMKKQEPRVKKAYEDLQAALKTGDTQTIFDAKIEYQRIMMNTTIQNNRYKNMVDDLTDKVANVNQTALDYVNDNMPSIYTANYNAFSTEQIKGYSFSLVNENAVRELMTTDKMLVPTKKKLDIPKDKRWNTKFINSQVTQGILQGESVQKIANRILPEIVSKSDRPDLIKRNKAAAIRNARTMTTAAENKGRNDSFKQATKDGIILEREWIAAHDERTRDWHRELDGIKVGVDEPWENDFGEIMFPGDPTADAANVYNCRCAIRAHVKGFNWNKSDVIDGESKEVKETNISKSTIVNGKDISDTWVRRADTFDFEIEDVINAQGFDGLPRVVDVEEFEKYVKESNIIMQRGYTAPSEEALRQYQNELYKGKWYVDCSNGGSAYGKGMYSVYDNGIKLSEESIRVGKRYSDGKNGIVETFTMAKDSRIILYEDAQKLAKEYKNMIEDKYGSFKKYKEELSKKSASSIKEKLDLNDMEYKYMLDRYFEVDMGDDVIKWYKSLVDAQKEKINSKIRDIATKAFRSIEKISEDVDIGSVCALKGYDAILVEREGYAVILNRTKVIFKRGIL